MKKIITLMAIVGFSAVVYAVRDKFYDKVVVRDHSRCDERITRLQAELARRGGSVVVEASPTVRNATSSKRMISNVSKFPGATKLQKELFAKSDVH